MKEAENWKGLPLEARKETKNILRNDILERYLEIKNTGFHSIKSLCSTLTKPTWVIKIYPLEADRLFEQLNDPKLQQILGMYIAALKNKSNNSYSSVLKKLKNSLSVLTSTNSISGEL